MFIALITKEIPRVFRGLCQKGGWRPYLYFLWQIIISHWVTSLITSVRGSLPPLDVSYQPWSLSLCPESLHSLSRFSADNFSMSRSILPLCFFFWSQSVCQECSLHRIPNLNLTNPYPLTFSSRSSSLWRMPWFPRKRGRKYANTYVAIHMGFGACSFCLIHVSIPHTKAQHSFSKCLTNR